MEKPPFSANIRFQIWLNKKTAQQFEYSDFKRNYKESFLTINYFIIISDLKQGLTMQSFI